MTVKNFRKYSKALLNGCFSNHHRKELLYSFSLINKILIFLYWYFLKQNGFLLGHTCSIKKVDKYKLKFKTKPWITPALKKSILKTLLKSDNCKRSSNKRKIRNKKTTKICFLQFWSKAKLTAAITTLNPTGTALKIHGTSQKS